MFNKIKTNYVIQFFGIAAILSFYSEVVVAADASPSLQIEEIVVTARKREENMQSKDNPSSKKVKKRNKKTKSKK